MTGDVGRDLDPPVRWVRFVWDEPNLVGEPAQGLDASRTTFLYELDGDGCVLRSVELMGSADIPIAAASLADFWEAQEYRFQPATKALMVYERQYGGVPEGTASDWCDHPIDEITSAEFNEVWLRSREYLRNHPRSEHFR